MYLLEENVKDYIQAREGLDGSFLIKQLQKHLKPNSTVLELGMGGGKDLDILRKTFIPTGSDYSQAFLDYYQKLHPAADLHLLDAVTLKIKQKFDCIYSNKVLHHLSKENLIKSFARQSKLLNQNGLLFHSFWYGEKEIKTDGLHFNKYKLKQIKDLIGENLKIVEFEFYQELNLNDSFYLILKKNKQI